MRGFIRYKKSHGELKQQCVRLMGHEYVLAGMGKMDVEGRELCLMPSWIGLPVSGFPFSFLFFFLFLAERKLSQKTSTLPISKPASILNFFFFLSFCNFFGEKTKQNKNYSPPLPKHYLPSCISRLCSKSHFPLCFHNTSSKTGTLSKIRFSYAQFQPRTSNMDL